MKDAALVLEVLTLMAQRQSGNPRGFQTYKLAKANRPLNDQNGVNVVVDGEYILADRRPTATVVWSFSRGQDIRVLGDSITFIGEEN